MSDKCYHVENTGPGTRIKKCRNNAKYYSKNGYYKSCEKHKKDDMIKIGVCDSCEKKAYYSNRITGTPILIISSFLCFSQDL